METNRIYQGDCLELLGQMEDESVDSIVTDPPYGINFMGKEWDYQIPGVDVWEECLRVLKPGAHIMVACGTRTQHRMAVNIEDAGFELRDLVAWLYGSGFPKNHDISKAIDKAAGAKGNRGPMKRGGERLMNQAPNGKRDNEGKWGDESGRDPYTYSPTTPEAQQWEGWGTALKPAMELWTLARKPLIGTVVENVLGYSTGGLNIDESRISTGEKITNHSRGAESALSKGKYGDSSAQETHQTTGQAQGRFPSNVIHDGSDEVVRLFPVPHGAGHKRGGGLSKNGSSIFCGNHDGNGERYGDSGSAARFFYCAKASKDRAKHNTHPTVKPLKLIEYLTRLITPKGGVVLDPYGGSGTAAVAAIENGFEYILFEHEPEYIKIAKQRVRNAEPSLF